MACSINGFTHYCQFKIIDLEKKQQLGIKRENKSNIPAGIFLLLTTQSPVPRKTLTPGIATHNSNFKTNNASSRVADHLYHNLIHREKI